MISFLELTKQVNVINDLILSGMVCEHDDTSEEEICFSHHLLATKFWFSRISWPNKKRFVLALLQDVQSAWTLSLLLKSMWNCRPKDSVLSANTDPVWSSYDQVPMDHNRTAMPITTLAQVMRNDRMWFLSLESEAQAMVLSELLTISGGPVMWAVLRRAQSLYEQYRDSQLQNLQECIVLIDQPMEKTPQQASPEKGKKDTPSSLKETSGTQDKNAPQPGRAQKELDINLAAWHSTVKSLKDTQKIEELEMTFNDGSKKKIWKVNRPKPEGLETVDFLQLLPSSIAKRVLSYLPRMQLGDYARVNRYWAYLVDDLRAELIARQKINLDFEKLNEVMLRHDTSLELVEQIDFRPAPLSSMGNPSNAEGKPPRPPPSMKASEKSGGAYSFRHFLNEKLNKPVPIPAPIRNMADLNERLERRGAADENLWRWCESILKHAKKDEMAKDITEKEGVLVLGNAHFPCPLMKQALKVPLRKPLYKDPAITPAVKPRRNISNATVIPAPYEESMKRYSLWTRDISRLYPVFKVPSYHYPN